MRVLLGLNDHWAFIPYERFGVPQEIGNLIQTLGMQYKMIPHNITECQWLIAGTMTPASGQ